MKYFIFILSITASFFFQSSWGFCSEDKVIRLIDLSEKSESVWTWSDISPTSSGKVEAKIRDKKALNDKIREDEKNSEKEEITDDVAVQKDEKEKETVQWLINSYILETYKAQWDKILKDMDLSLQKKIPDIEKRTQAYTSIQTTLELRKNRILKVNISEVNKSLLNSYFEYMIDSLEKKKESLKE